MALDASLIPEGRIGRAEAEAKLHLAHLSEVTPEYLASLTLNEFEAAANDVTSLFTSALGRIRATHYRWLKYGFNCGAMPAQGHHSNANPAAQIKRDAGWSFRGMGLSCDASDIADEQSRAFKDGERKAIYEAEFRAAAMAADAAFRGLLIRLRDLKRGWGETGASSPSSHLTTDVAGQAEPQDDVLEVRPGKLAALDQLLVDAHALHEKLVDMVLRFLPGRTFLKS